MIYMQCGRLIDNHKGLVRDGKVKLVGVELTWTWNTTSSIIIGSECWLLTLGRLRMRSETLCRTVAADVKFHV